MARFAVSYSGVVEVEATNEDEAFAIVHGILGSFRHTIGDAEIVDDGVEEVEE